MPRGQGQNNSFFHRNPITPSVNNKRRDLADKRASERRAAEEELRNAPTMIDKAGRKIWENNLGQRHREDGPAVIFPDGRKLYFLNGFSVTEEQWLYIIKDREKIRNNPNKRIKHNHSRYEPGKAGCPVCYPIT